MLMLVIAMVGASWIYYDLLCDDARQLGFDAGYKVVDLGSGSGTLCRGIARALPSVDVVGVEISLVPWGRALLHRAVFGPGNQVFHRQDFWSYNVHHHHAIVIYLLGPLMDRMSKKLVDEAAPGTLIISNRFPLTGDWHPDEIRIPKGQGLLENKLYMYRR
jgi:hypothetical protein